MSKRNPRKTTRLTQSELEKIANNFGEISDEDDLEPFPGSDSDDPLFEYDSDTDELSSSSSETVEKIKTFLQRDQPSGSTQNVGLTLPSTSLSSTSPCQTLESVTLLETDSQPNLELQSLEPDTLSEPDQTLNEALDLEPSIGQAWGPPVGNYKLIPPFSIPSGVCPNVAAMLANGTPADFFEAIVDNRIISLICNQTNIFATQYLMNTDATPSSRLHDWYPTTNSEIRTFLGLVAWMGLVRMPSISDYWSSDQVFSNNFAKNVMSRNRFELLLRMIHFADNKVADQTDKLYKIRPLVDMLTSNFKSLYVPEEYICVDETLLPFRGRLGFRQYIKTKRHRYGVKLFKVCSGLGYTYNLKIYAGKEDTNVTPEKVVLYLVADLLNQGRTLITDNWYTSLPLAYRMLNMNTHLIGTIRKTRKGLPKEVINAKLKKGEIISLENEDGITITNWKDQRNILMLSTKHGSQMVEVACNRQTKLKPEVVLDYNKGKGSVDISDQMGAYSNPLRKSIKWYRKVAFELLLTTAMVNAYILYKLVTNYNISVTDFKIQIVKHLVSAKDKENVATQTKRFKVSHELQTAKEGNKHYRRKMCKNCYKKNAEQGGRKYAMNKTKKVDTYCNQCENQQFLCLECFNEIHN